VYEQLEVDGEGSVVVIINDKEQPEQTSSRETQLRAGTTRVSAAVRTERHRQTRQTVHPPTCRQLSAYQELLHRFFILHCCFLLLITFRRRLASGEGTVSLGVRQSRCHAVCVSTAFVSAAKVMRCIQCSRFLFVDKGGSIG